jgi:hypothetical protein
MEMSQHGKYAAHSYILEAGRTGYGVHDVKVKMILYENLWE